MALCLAGCGQALASQTDAASKAHPEATSQITPTNPPVNPQYADYLPVLERTIGDHLRYPPKALSANQQGDVVVAISISRDGTILAAQVIRTSGNAALDAEGRNVFNRIVRFPAVPDNVYPEAKTFELTLPIHFSLYK